MIMTNVIGTPLIKAKVLASCTLIALKLHHLIRLQLTGKNVKYIVVSFIIYSISMSLTFAAILAVFVVMSGHNGEFQKNLPTEFVDLAFPKSTCKSYSSAPLATHGSGIGYLKDRTNPLICGGLYGYELMSSCYKLDLMTGEYTLDRTLFHPRVYSGSGLALTGLQMLNFH